MAYAVSCKTDPVRHVLSSLIAETQAPITPDQILRQFRATADKRSSDKELILLLESISCKRPNFRQVLKEIKYTLQRKDPMYALLVFAELINDDPLWSTKFASGLEMPPPLNSRVAQIPPEHPVEIPVEQMKGIVIDSHADEQSNGDQHLLKQLDPSTSTPLNSRKLDDTPGLSLMSAGSGRIYEGPQRPIEPISARADLSLIKERVMNAVSDNSVMEFLGTINFSNKKAKDGNGNDKDNVNGNVNTIASPHKSGASSSSVRSDHNRNNGLLDEYRTHMLWDYCKIDDQKPLRRHDLSALPLENQQRVLLNDLIYCLSGMRGTYIQPQPTYHQVTTIASYETHFNLHVQLEKSLVEMVEEILPLASHFVGIQKIVADTDGLCQVNNALNAAVQTIIHDFHLLLAQLELELQANQLTVPKMLYYVQPTIWTMEVIWTALADMQLFNFNGAAVLSHLCARIKQLEGDTSAQKLITDLTSKAAEPYMRMLQLWIQKGIIVDRTDEFMVVDNELRHKGELPEHYSDDYWEKRYTIRSQAIPTFLAKYADKILRTGKYLNVIRQCGKRVMPIQQMNLKLDPTNEQHVYVINDAYYFAAHMLLDVLLTENDLMGHLQSVKRYLLLNQGDFTMQFMDVCEDELSKNVDQVLPMTLENLLGLTLRISSARSDPYKDDLHCELLTYDLVTQMSKIMDQKEEYWKTNDRLDLSGLECFAFTYEVKWPVSLVLNHISITKYQMLFRQLFYCKHVERQLCKIWKENSIAKKFSPHAAELYRSAFTLRQRMMNAIQNLEYYMMIEIIEPNWHTFIEKMKKVENVDMVLSLHQDFLDLCLKNCMLTETSHLNRAIFKLCKICLKFCEFIQRSQRVFLDAELKSMVCDSSDESTDLSDSEPDMSDRLQGETSMDQADTFGERVKRFDLEFTGMLISFLKQINDLAKDNTADRYLNLVHRINFNGFYSQQMDKLCVQDAMG